MFGRTDLLDRLAGSLTEVHATGKGRILAMRGRRQVGKSTAVTAFVEQVDTPHAYFTGVKLAPMHRQHLQLAVHWCQLDPGEVGMRGVHLLDEGGDRGRLAHLAAAAHCEDATLAGGVHLGEAAGEPIEKVRASKHEQPNCQPSMLHNSMLLKRRRNARSKAKESSVIK